MIIMQLVMEDQMISTHSQGRSYCASGTAALHSSAMISIRNSETEVFTVSIVD